MNGTTAHGGRARRRWARVCDAVKYCSDRCRRSHGQAHRPLGPS
ncbi:DUF2256 domain-containing protein [Cupriavidus sp. amp6]